MKIKELCRWQLRITLGRGAWSITLGRWTWCKYCYKDVQPEIGDGIWVCPDCDHGLALLEDEEIQEIIQIRLTQEKLIKMNEELKELEEEIAEEEIAEGKSIVNRKDKRNEKDNSTQRY